MMQARSMFHSPRALSPFLQAGSSTLKTLIGKMAKICLIEDRFGRFRSMWNDAYFPL